MEYILHSKQDYDDYELCHEDLDIDDDDADCECD